MSVHSSQRRKRRDGNRFKVKGMNHSEFLSRIRKTLYYGKLPMADCFTLPVTEFAAELYSKVKAGRSVERLSAEEAGSLLRKTCVSPCSLVLAVLYLDRLNTLNPNYLDAAIPSELFLISVMVASKFLNDDGEDDEVLNSEWAASAGLTLKHVNQLEKQFLNAIKWQVFVKDTEFWSRLRDMERSIALNEGKKRGWFSYTELESLLDLFDSLTLAHTLLTVSMVCLASYTAGVLTLVGSTLLVSQLPGSYLGPHPPPATTTTPPPPLPPPGLPEVLHETAHLNKSSPSPLLYTSSSCSYNECDERLPYYDNDLLKANENWNGFLRNGHQTGIEPSYLVRLSNEANNKRNDSLADLDFVFSRGYYNNNMNNDYRDDDDGDYIEMFETTSTINYLFTVARYLSDLPGQIRRGLPPQIVSVVE